MPIVNIDKESFSKRVIRLFDMWSKTPELFSHADCISVPLGHEETMYAKSPTLYSWLFGYEVPDSVLVLCFTTEGGTTRRVLHFLSGIIYMYVEKILSIIFLN